MPCSQANVQANVSVGYQFILIVGDTAAKRDNF